MNHKRIPTLATILILAIVVILVGTVPAAAKAERIYYTGVDCPIYIGPPAKEWVSEDGVLHQRGIPMTTSLTYNLPELNGKNYIMANMDVDMATGAVHVYGTVDIHPNGIDGTWIGYFSTHVSPEGVLNGRAVAHGTGELEGMKSFNKISSPEVLDPACFNMNTAGIGYILIP
jgi:hypothetical protein